MGASDKSGVPRSGQILVDLDERPGAAEDKKMRYLKYLALLAICTLVAAAPSRAQHVSIGVGIGAPAYYGPAPVCGYGYHGDFPLACAPYGELRPCHVGRRGS